ncbi:putative C6 transcription factor [Aspergillus japonicus CBS 114.51]|uniref:Putative C6 transcription factor n=2 Tax=Aspergillus TaxID=5052 RepID=A0A2V5GSK4_ASPV1|nr:putative C6 transcription factor [Aspergillus japonicus CBS 114.51]PYI14245.1 putative C6 transcription factor [Aspergillus violaceofuscus CBS 115571]RAH79267.1 putative C6 transcription factor [Aspergillus japonicus CBS 114.51]
MEVRRPAGRYGDTPTRTYQRTYKACLSCRQRKAKCNLGTDQDGFPIGPPCAKCRREQRECIFSEKRAWERSSKRGLSEDAPMSSPSTRRRLSDHTRQDREVPDDVLNVGADSPFGNGSMPENEGGGSHTNRTSEIRTGRRDLTHDVLQVFDDHTIDHSTTGRSNSSLQSQAFDTRQTRRRSVPDDVLHVFDERIGSESTEQHHESRRSHHSSVPELYATRTRNLPDGKPQGGDRRSGGDNSNHADDDRGFQSSYDTETRSSQHPATSNLANSMMRTVVSSGNDALNILFEAAVAHSQENMANDFQSQSQTIQDNASHGKGTGNSTMNPPQFKYPTEALAKAKRPVQLSPASEEVLKVWETCRFVRMGWFTSREAVTLIDLFFKNMVPLSPILTNFYADHSNHQHLITCDPALCCAILMLSSRYHVLPGAGGESRNFFIHHRLWQHCQHLVMRLVFGQERSSHAKNRSIGTIEALLLMSEWHPRSLHFPPESDGWDSDLVLVPEPQSQDDSSSNRWLEDMVEPARRSDQMSWMLLGSALSLAHELGIFELDDKKCDYASLYEGFISNDQIKLRRLRVQRLLYVYINQLAWRIGCVSLMPQSLNHTILGRQTTRDVSHSEDEWLALMDSWMDLTKLAKNVTDMFFPSISFARQQLHSGRYIDLLDHFCPLLQKWREQHLRHDVLSKHFYDILFIEYNFVRVYTHSVGMQAVVERIVADNDSNVEEVRAMHIDPIDYNYIQEVIDGCCQILQKVIELGDSGALRFSPVRIFLRITSSSIFLMKALSLGTRPARLRESLDILERCVQVLKSNALDDIHLSTRYAELLEMHVSRLRRNLLASSKSAKNSHGTTTRNSMVPQQSTESDNPAPMAETPVSQSLADVSLFPQLNDIAGDDWLSLPFDPSMAPFGINSCGQFPAYGGGALNFIWNLPS